MSEFTQTQEKEAKHVGTQYEERESTVVTIRCLSAVPVDLEKLLAEIESEEGQAN